jgi:UDP-N-acetylmuramate--alanine ligase
MEMPRNNGPFHIIGIGGIGMSAIAEILLELGHKVQGSDAKDSANTQRLRQRGIPVHIGASASNLDGARYVVISSAIKPDNAELVAARAQRLPVIRRADMLGELMRLRKPVSVTGTHGKTTTTSLIAQIFEHAELDPTVITGGIINDWGSNARLGKGAWMVVEADESDGTFIRIPTEIGVVTNIDPEHLDYFGTVEKMNAAYRSFYTNIPFYGTAVTCIDHPVVRSMLAETNHDLMCKVLTYGFAADADLQLSDVRAKDGGVLFDIAVSDRLAGGARTVRDLFMPLPGEHSALNAAAAFAVCAQAGIADDRIRKAMAAFSGVKRRYTRTGSWNGVGIFDDYAHHPVEVAAVLKAARKSTSGRVIAIFQPHRYSRVGSLFTEFSQCFSDADSVLVSPIYSAGEAVVAGLDNQSMAAGIRQSGHGDVQVIENESDIAPIIARSARAGDTVIFLGAGTITDWAYKLPETLAGTAA